MQNAEHSINTLQGLKKQGVRISMDDFGTGYSSLNYLKRFPIDRIKLDQSFVRDLPGDKDDAAIAMAVIAMGRSLELVVIAEGVETEEQLAFLKRSRLRPAAGLPALPSAPGRGVREVPRPEPRTADHGGATLAVRRRPPVRTESCRGAERREIAGRDQPRLPQSSDSRTISRPSRPVAVVAAEAARLPKAQRLVELRSRRRFAGRPRAG